jgi:hypothetical protein
MVPGDIITLEGAPPGESLRRHGASVALLGGICLRRAQRVEVRSRDAA